MKKLLLLLLVPLAILSCNESDVLPNNDPVELASTLSAQFNVEVATITDTSALIYTTFLYGSDTSQDIVINKYGVVVSESIDFSPNTVQQSAGELQAGEAFAIELTGLKAATPYYIKVYIESSETGEIAYSETVLFTTYSTEEVDSRAVTFDIATESTGTTTATIAITYDLVGAEVVSFDAKGVGIILSESVDFSPNAIYALSLSTTENTTFKLTISDLTEGTTYYCKVYIENFLGERLLSDTHSFATTTYVEPLPEDSTKVYLSELSYYNCPDEDMWIIQDATATNMSDFEGLRYALNAARDDDRLVWLSFPNLTSIPDANVGVSPFYVNRTVVTASFPQAIYVGKAFFRLCSTLTSVSIPAATEIGNGAFAQCESLTHIEVNPAYYTLENGVLYSSDKTTLHTYLYSNTAAPYEAPQSVTTVVTSAFTCTSVTALTLPQVTEVEGSAMNYCTEMVSFSAPQLAVVRSNGFYNCTALATLSLPRVTAIEEQAFSNLYASCAITLSTDAVITSIGNQLPDEYPFYKMSLTLGSQNEQWVVGDTLLDDSGAKYKFKEITLQ